MTSADVFENIKITKRTKMKLRKEKDDGEETNKGYYTSLHNLQLQRLHLEVLIDLEYLSTLGK